MAEPTTDRCDLTDLLVSACGCRHHLGGQTPDEQATQHRAELLDNGWVAAQYPGSCARCGTWFRSGAAIRAEPGMGWRAECCPGDDDKPTEETRK